jgi:hypothetical protein
VDGAVQTKSGSVAMLWAETGMTVVSIAVFGLFAWLVIRLWPRPKVTTAAV